MTASEDAESDFAGLFDNDRSVTVLGGHST